jgi:hypothetical protein
MTVTAVPRNTRYQADATPYLGRTCTGWIAPALPGAFHLFDDLVGEREQLIGNLQAEGIGSLHVDDKFEFGRLHYWQVAGSFAFEDPTRVYSRLPIRLHNVRAITHEAPRNMLSEMIAGLAQMSMPRPDGQKGVPRVAQIRHYQRV